MGSDVFPELLKGSLTGSEACKTLRPPQVERLFHEEQGSCLPDTLLPEKDHSDF